MLNNAIAWMFQIHYPTPIKWVWVATSCLNVLLMLWLAIRTRSWAWRAYLGMAALSSIFRASPIWHTWMDGMLCATAVAFGVSLLPRYARAFAFCIAITLIGALMIMKPPDWPKYSKVAYRLRLYTSVTMTGGAALAVIEPWVKAVVRRGIDWAGWDRWTGTNVKAEMNWPALIAAVWFLIWWMSLVQWRTDQETPEYWVLWWRVAVGAAVGRGVCLVGWLMLSYFREHFDRDEHARAGEALVG